LGVIRTTVVTPRAFRRRRDLTWLEWAFLALTTAILLYGLVVLASQYTLTPVDSVRERVRGVVVLSWFALPLLLILVGQVFIARGEAAKFALLLTALIVTGLLVILYNGPPSSGHTGPGPAGIVAATLFLAVTSPLVGVSMLGLWISTLLSRS